MPSYAELTSIADNEQAKAVLLSGSSIAFLLSALGEYLERPYNWRGSGELDNLTEEEKDDIDARIALAERELMSGLTGTIFMSAVWVAGSFQLNGQIVLKEEAPNLYQVLQDAGSEWIISETEIQLPDMAGLFPVGAKLSIGETGGEETHTLSIDEIPEHTHAEIAAIETIINGGLEAPATAAIATIGETGIAGLGQAHNNLPPFYSFAFFIWA